MTDPIEVSVWEHLGSGTWGQVGGVTYERIEFEPRHQDAGAWTMTIPQGEQAEAVRQPRLVTTTFRDVLYTWTITPRRMVLADDGGLSVIVGGFDAVSMLARPVAFPSPTKPVGDQDAAEWKMTGPAETVIRALVVANLKDRYGLDFDAPPSEGRGATVTAATRFESIGAVWPKLAKAGGIGVRFGLVPTTSSTRARLQLSFTEPEDKTVRVVLATTDGSLASWEYEEGEPTLTKAFVGGIGEGVGQKIVEVTTPESEAQAEEWFGHRESYVEGPDTFDEQPYIDAGEEAIREGAATTTLTMEADEPLGTRAFEAFNPGDQVTVIPYVTVVDGVLMGVELQDEISAIRVAHEEAGDPDVTPMIGDPDLANDDEAAAADAFIAREQRQLKRAFARATINRKRGTV